MKKHLPISLSIAGLFLVQSIAITNAQNVINGDNSNNFVRQRSGDPSVRGLTFNFFGGNDRLFLERNDDLAGLNDGVANMGDGRDVVITSFEMSGTFDLGTGNDFFASAGSVFGPSFNKINVLAGPGNDLIVVTTEDSRYQGDLGNDIFVSDGASNTFDGGEGIDTYSAEAAESAAGIDLGSGTAFARFNLKSDSLINIENVRGSLFNDQIFGDANNNRIDGLEGNDSIDGDPGNDTISGGTGRNTLFGNSGIDTLVVQGSITSRTRISADAIRVVGAINGVAFEHNASGFEQVLDNNVLKSVAFFMGESATNSVQTTQIAESPVEAAIAGFGAGQTLNGTGGVDRIDGGAGHDDITGLAGNDTLNGNDGDDMILGGEGSDRLSGGNGNDALDGGAANDVLDGGANNDTLTGGLGADRLTGGAGNDSFQFTTALAGNADTITDYNLAQDTIRIRSSLVGNLPAGALASGRFKNTSQGSVDADDRIVYNARNGQLSFDSNGSRAGGSVLIATLPVNLAMVAGEIVIVP